MSNFWQTAYYQRTNYLPSDYEFKFSWGCFWAAHFVYSFVEDGRRIIPVDQEQKAHQRLLGPVKFWIPSTTFEKLQCAASFPLFQLSGNKCRFFFFLNFSHSQLYMCTHLQQPDRKALESSFVGVTAQKPNSLCTEHISTEQRRTNRDLILCPCSYHRAQEAQTKPPQMNHCSGTN